MIIVLVTFWLLLMTVFMTGGAGMCGVGSFAFWLTQLYSMMHGRMGKIAVDDLGALGTNLYGYSGRDSPSC